MRLQLDCSCEKSKLIRENSCEFGKEDHEAARGLLVLGVIYKVTQ